MAISSTFGDREGVRVRASFTKYEDTELLEDQWEIGFINDLDFKWQFESFTASNGQGDVWVWVTGSSDINTLKAHSSILSVIEE